MHLKCSFPIFILTVFCTDREKAELFVLVNVKEQECWMLLNTHFIILCLMVLIKADNAFFYTSHHFPASHEGNPRSVLVTLKEEVNVKYKRKGFLSPNES